MAQASRERPGLAEIFAGPLARGTREGALIVIGATAIYLALALVSYHPGDPGWSHTGHVGRVANHGGVVGAWLADVFLYLFGYMAYLFPAMVGYAGWVVYGGLEADGGTDVYQVTTRSVGFVVTLAAGCGLATLHYHAGGALPLDAGGILGNLIGRGLQGVFSSLGATLFLLALFLTGLSLFTGISWLSVMDLTGRYSLCLGAMGVAQARRVREWLAAREARRARESEVERKRTKSRARRTPRIEPQVPTVAPAPRIEREVRQVRLFGPAEDGAPLPSVALLDEPPASRRVISDAALDAMSRQVELKLGDFGIEVEVVAVHPGPVVTRFELQPAPGLKVSKVSNLAKDLARSLSTISVRIVEVIPGKSVIGLEIPNEERDLVVLSELLKSGEYDRASSPLTLVLGKDIGGAPVVADLARMPHLLVAGTTGSGKSVAINAMILSLLYKATAEQVRMIMIDPKMLELSVYEGIPHLLAPVVTDMKHASNALRWCVAEMERRYQLMSMLGVRNIAGFNRKLKEARLKGEPIRDPLYQSLGEADPVPELEPLPYIVVVVDELADLMMVTGKKVEELIARLAQKARASGIHLVLATQRPSVDVITGLIKANIPSRIAFQVSSKVDSRTIIDQMGADNLLGHGDMLYMGPSMTAPSRVHGAFVSDQEVHRVVGALKRKGAPAYVDEILEGGASVDEGLGAFAEVVGVQCADAESDPLYDQAVRIVTETRRASISGVQRRLKVGYNRAARMLEQMEQTGVVGALETNGAREVLAPPPPAD
jgi:S-DNA-T family DNA segregation ATPase FtsK/SpoIIIE